MYDEPIEPQGPPVYDPRLTPEDIAEFERIAAEDKENGRVISAKLVAFGKVKLETGRHINWHAGYGSTITLRRRDGRWYVETHIRWRV